MRTNTNNELGIRGQRGEERGGERGREGGAESGLVYHAAALGIYLDPINKIQKYFRGHTDDVMALCVLSPTLEGESEILNFSRAYDDFIFVFFFIPFNLFCYSTLLSFFVCLLFLFVLSYTYSQLHFLTFAFHVHLSSPTLTSHS